MAVVDPPRVPVAAPPVVSVEHGTSASVNASIDSYLGAGDHMAMIMTGTLWLCGALIVLIALTWALGVLPVAVKLF